VRVMTGTAPGRDESGPYAPPMFTGKDAELYMNTQVNRQACLFTCVFMLISKA
jgi:hypothetical protein